MKPKILRVFSLWNRPCQINSVPKWKTPTLLQRTPRHLTSAKSTSITGQLLQRRNVFLSATNNDATIYALSTASGRAALAIIRCSGTGCLDILGRLTSGKGDIKPRQATLRRLVRKDDGGNVQDVIDPAAVVLFFPGPRTVTGEDVLEFHIHGGNATTKAVLSAVAECHSNSNPIRYAEAGEFTRRAFYNNRLDLVQTEALGNMLSAETEQQRQLATVATTDRLSRQYEAWRRALLAARGELEALIDFSEDQHFEESPRQLVSSVSNQVSNLKNQIDSSITQVAKGELLQHGVKIALVGLPNAGKSSLLNKIVQREAAIVSPEPGTTRDVVEINVDIGGFFCKFGDLAGLRSDMLGLDDKSNDQIGLVEKEGIRRAKAHALNSDIVVLVVAADESTFQDWSIKITLGDDLVSFLQECDGGSKRVLLALNKIDLLNTSVVAGKLDGVQFTNLPAHFDPNAITTVAMSCIEDEANNQNVGVQKLLKETTSTIREMTSSENAGELWKELLGASQRQRSLLIECNRYLDEFLLELQTVSGSEADDLDIVLAAEQLRHAALCLSRITGRGGGGDVEEVLGVVFEKFCVGK